ncbi:MAG: hypothetical protein J1E01_07300 [Acetatifactor sp.]|nr:hypothetical protein [Acetatifactor sp.]
MLILYESRIIWRFQKLPEKTGLFALAVESPVFDDSQWESVTLPHTWNAVDGADGWYLPRCTSDYSILDPY